MKRMTFAEVVAVIVLVAVIALLVAVSVGVRYREMNMRSDRRLEDAAQSMRGITWMLKNLPAAPRFEEIDARLDLLEHQVEEIDPSRTRHAIEWHGLDARLRMLEHQVERIEHGFIAATAPAHLAPEVDPVVTFLRSEIGVERTTSAGQVEIRNVVEE